MPTWGWIVLCVGAFCFGWTLGADWYDRYKPRSRRVRSMHGSVSDYYIDSEKGDDEKGDGSKEKPFKTARRLQAEFIGRPKPNRYCGLTGCEIRQRHSHTEDLIRRIRGK